MIEFGVFEAHKFSLVLILHIRNVHAKDIEFTKFLFVGSEDTTHSARKGGSNDTGGVLV